MDAYFYILFSPKVNKFYIGHTTEPLEERIRKHNSARSGFTGTSRDWMPVYKENFTSKQLAYAREREVKLWKSKSRIQKLDDGSEHLGLKSQCS
jgi:putative endonuclease